MRQFYEHQDNAYNTTAKLTFVMAVAIIGTILISGGIITYLFAFFMYLDGVEPSRLKTTLIWVFCFASTSIGVVVAIGTISKMLQLRAGGRVIAEDVGGRLITEPRDDDERRLLNIVEEISVASGIPTPPVYLLGLCDGINAFAAGHNPREAVVAVTRGAIRNLNRDQLQGVIAHEYAHILNGDMALNMKMVGWLHGVLAITILADRLIEIGCEALFRERRTMFSQNDNGLGGILPIVIGCGLWPVGLIGTFMALLAKAATSRQREFLADAYAVQFTRHPEGLADAFKRLAGHDAGSRVRSSKAIEASHMFFAEGCGRLASRLASHPPLVDRVLRLDPTWDGTPLFAGEDQIGEFTGAFQGALGLVSGASDMTDNGPVAGLEAQLQERVREVPDMLATVAFAESVLSSLPDPLVQIIEAPGGTSLVLHGLWLAHAKDESIGYDMLPKLQAERLNPLVPFLREMNSAQQVMLLDKAADALGKARGPERRTLREVNQCFIDACETDNLFQWMWNAIVSESLGLEKDRKPRYGKLSQVEGACEVVLSRVSYASGSKAVAGFSFQRGLANLALENISLLDEADCDWEKFQMAVDLIAQLAAAPRRQVLVACSSALSSDQDITPDESYIIRGICQRLGYEVPTIFAGQPILPGT